MGLAGYIYVYMCICNICNNNKEKGVINFKLGYKELEGSGVEMI